MRNPYQRDKKPGRVGGDPLKNIVGEAAGVKGQEVQVGKVGINSGVAPTVKMGQSSSFTTSTGLVNALDVVKGVSNVMSGVNNVMDAHDKMKASQMEKDISDLTSSEQWTNNEAEGYLDDDAKNAALQNIYKNYENSFTKNKGRAWYQGKVADTNIQYQNLGFEREMARLQLDAEKARAEGNEEDAAANFKSGMDLLRKKYAGDSARMNQIEAQDLVAGAKWATHVQESVDFLTRQWEAKGGIQNLATSVSTDVGYEDWKKRAITDMALGDAGGLGEQLLQMYNPNNDQFEGPYADQIDAKLDSILQPVYNKAVAMETEHQKNNHFAAMGSIPRATVSAVVGAGSQGSGNAESRQAGMNQVASDGIARMLAFTGSSPVPLAPWQKRQQIQQGLSDIVTGVYRANPGFTPEQASSMIDAVISDNETELISQLLPADATDEEKKQFLADMRGYAKADLRAAREQRDGEVNQQTREAQSEAETPVTNNNDLNGRINKNSLMQLAEGKAEKTGVLLLDKDNLPLTGRDLVASTQRATNLIFTAGLMRGQNAGELAGTIKTYQEMVKDFAEGTTTAENITSFLEEATQGSPYIVSYDSRGTAVITWDPEARGNVQTQARAALGLATRYMTVDPETGFFRPYGKTDSALFNEKLGTLMMDAFRAGQGLTESGAKGIEEVVTTSRAILSSDTAMRNAAVVITTALEAELGYKMEDDQRRNFTTLLTAQLEVASPGTPSWDAVLETVENAVKGRSSLVTIKAEKMLSDFSSQPYTDDVAKALGGALGFTVDSEGKVSTPDEFHQTIFEKMSFGSWDRLGEGFADDSAIQLLDGARTGDIQQMFAIGVANGVFINTQGKMQLHPDYADNPTEAAKKMAQLIHGNGMYPSYQRDEDGSVVAVNLNNSTAQWKLNSDGKFVRDGVVGVNFTGANSSAAISQGLNKEQGYNPGETSEYAPVRHAVGRGAVVTDSDPNRIFYVHLERGGIASGRSRENVRAWTSKPENRASIASWTRPGRLLWTEGMSADRHVLANQIEATIEDLKSAGVLVNTEDSAEAQSFAALLRNGKVKDLARTEEGMEMWQRVRDMAKAQGYNPDNPPMWTVNLAILSTLLPEQSNAIENMSIYDLHASKSFEPMAYSGEQDSGLPDNRRGYDSLMRYEFENFTPVGEGKTGSMSLALFAPITAREAYLGDPRTMVREKTMVEPRRVLPDVD